MAKKPNQTKRGDIGPTRISLRTRTMFDRLHHDHLSYFGRTAPLWECILARTIGPMPLRWDAREWPASPEEAGMGPDAEGLDRTGSRVLQTMMSGRGSIDAPFQAGDLPLDVAMATGRHLIVRGPDIESETLRVKELITEWMRGRDEWHQRAESAGLDITPFVATLNGQPLKKGVYAFHDGPFATTPGVRRLRDPDLGSDVRSGILAVGKMDRSHFTIATQSNWTLIGCHGGGGEAITEMLVDDFDEVLRIGNGEKP